MTHGVLDLLAGGLSTPAICQRPVISEVTADMRSARTGCNPGLHKSPIPAAGRNRSLRCVVALRSARGSATEPEEVPLGVSGRNGGCTFVGGRGLAVPAEPPKQIGSGGVERVVVV